MKKATVTVTTTEMVTARSGKVLVRTAIVDGELEGARIAIDTIPIDYDIHSLCIKNLEQLKDVVLAAQELMKAVTERTE